MFGRIGDILPRFRIYEKLFPDHHRLVQALSRAYLEILNFCSKAKAVFRRGKRSRGKYDHYPFYVSRPHNQ